MWGQGNGVAQEGVATPDRTRSRNRASFLRMTSELDNANHALALAFGVLDVFIVVPGSLWIVADATPSWRRRAPRRHHP